MNLNHSTLFRRELAIASSRVARSALVVGLTLLLHSDVVAQPSPTEFSSASDFLLEECTLKSKGKNAYYFPLKPGYKVVMEEEEEGVPLVKVIEVLHKTEKFHLPGLRKFKARVVEETDFEDGEEVNVTRFLIAICKETSAVFVFGEESLDIDPETGEVRTDFVYRVGDPDINGVVGPGLVMPGTVLLGSKYIFEGAEHVDAFGGAENVETGMTVTVPAGTFHPCVRVRETALNEEDVVDKVWCAGVGLVLDGASELVEFGKGKGKGKGN
jgi:hypothetical protein